MTLKVHFGSKEGSLTLDIQEGSTIKVNPTGDAARVPYGIREGSYLEASKVGKGGILIHEVWDSGFSAKTARKEQIKFPIRRGNFIQISDSLIAEGTD